MTLKNILEEAEKSFEKDLRDYIKPISVGQYNDKGVNIGFLPADDVVKSFLTEQITKAVESALEATRLEERDTSDSYNIGWNSAVAEQAKKTSKFINNK